MCKKVNLPLNIYEFLQINFYKSIFTIMKKVILLLLSISMLGFYSCTKDEKDDNTDGTGDGTTPVELTNYVSVDGTKTELTKDLIIEEGKYYLVDATSGDTTFLRRWKVYIATEDLEIGDSLSGTFTGLYTDIYSLEAESPAAGTYVANTAGDAIVPSYLSVIHADGFDFDEAGTVKAIEGDNSMVIAVAGDKTTFTLEGTSDGKAIKIAYTAKLNILGAKKKGAQELKF